MTIRRPSGLTLLTCALLILLPALAVLQYRWVGQVSAAERERMQRNLGVAATQFREAFDGELIRALLSLQVGPATVRDGSAERFADRYDTWLNTTTHPQIVAQVYLVSANDTQLLLRRWNPADRLFESTEWSAKLQPWRAQFEHEFENFRSGHPSDRRIVTGDEDSLLIAPLRNVVVNPPRPQAVEPIFGFTIIELNQRYIREQFVPELARRHFIHSGGDTYRVAVTLARDPQTVIYRSDPQAPVDIAQADATESIFGRIEPGFLFGRTGDNQSRDGVIGGGRNQNTAAPAPTRPAAPDESGRWRLVVQHQSGSLEGAIGSARRRNLAISFGVLLLLSISVGVLAVTSRRGQRLARQQMEFVAGVSHELRTPVAVIKSAAENLSHGVVGSGDRVKKYGQMIDSEARRLGEMVERVLQYAGIESGLGLGTRTALAPTEIIDAAVESAVSLLGPDVHVNRDIMPDLPPVIGDAAALRSAVQNLIANAVKYGGRDRFVGIRAEYFRDGRRREVRITVTDHGAGIPPSELPHIFEPFYRGADAVAQQIHGNGLGLSLVKRIVTAHGGKVFVTSRPGSGSAFTIALPAAEPDARANTVNSEVRVATQT